MKSAFATFASILLLGGCVTGQGAQYSLGASDKGVFTSRTPGTPIPADRIKGLDEGQLMSMFGTGVLDRKDDPARALRYQSDACMVFVDGVFSRDMARARRVAAVCRAEPFGDATALIRNAAVDAVDVCLPSAIHHAFVVPALHEGKHVFCETPLALGLDEARQMLDA